MLIVLTISFQMPPAVETSCHNVQSQPMDSFPHTDAIDVEPPSCQTPSLPLSRRSSGDIVEQTVEDQRGPLWLMTSVMCGSSLAPTDSSHSFHSVPLSEKTSSRNSDAPDDDMPSGTSSSSYGIARQTSGPVGVLNSLLRSTLSFLHSDDAMSYSMGVPLGDKGRVKSEANPRLLVSPIARMAMTQFLQYDDDVWFTENEHYYVERRGKFDKIWRLLRSLK